jgi:hypothetical protein
MDVDANGVYFAVDAVVKGCSLTGCTSGVTQIAGGFSRTGSLVAAGGSVAFDATSAVPSSCDGLYACPTTGCPASYSSLYGGGTGNHCGAVLDLAKSGNDVLYLFAGPAGFNYPNATVRCIGLSGTTCTSTNFDSNSAQPPIAADSSNDYYLFNGEASTAIVKCGAAAQCAPPSSPTTITLGASVTMMTVYGGTLYSFWPAGIFNGDVYSCSTAGCANMTAFNKGTAQPGGLAADADGVYFTINNGVYTCPLAGCGGAGARALATNQANPGIVRGQGSYVYWVNRGTSDGQGGYVAGTASIMRVAK